jgi:hypothetical protein
MHQEKVDALEETIAQLKTDLEEARRACITDVAPFIVFSLSLSLFHIRVALCC